MTVGLGVSIGTVNTVCAVATRDEGRHGPHRRAAGPPNTWRTTLTFDSTGTARVGRIPRHGRAIAEFADLTQRGAPTARVGHRALSASDLVATVADSVIRQTIGAKPEAGVGITITHPVAYPPEVVADLRHALDAVGLEQARLVAEPIAATAWLEAQYGPLMPGLALVYDLGGSGLTVTLVRVGAGCPVNPIVGEPLRSKVFGGRAFGALMARRAHWSADDTPTLVGVLSDAKITELRTAHIRKSLGLVYECLRIADVTMADVDRVLVVGGAARPPEVAGVLGDTLARPVFVAPDPERTVADGAAILACRSAAKPVAVAHRRVVRVGGSGLRRRLTRAAVTTAVAAAGALFAATAVANEGSSSVIIDASGVCIVAPSH
ncbi:Hsp70 family protein [Nocardia sp. CDC159]|uniref:Hsp70 family protein n=1 Tax=Nocardia pulmonis TaxID=2951408 RepID=A0A9X2IVX6_9NOCA|nr:MULTISPECIES: Hsp70 family protein [Nocardia]MCM6773678.1 Hsp70 family protein [Nocardia pulmonis]MCM6786565.1 Hsp70 family protein [Nocardia sp. CDC159]